jgi:hypothetical protein
MNLSLFQRMSMDQLKQFNLGSDPKLSYLTLQLTHFCNEYCKLGNGPSVLRVFLQNTSLLDYCVFCQWCKQDILKGDHNSFYYQIISLETVEEYNARFEEREKEKQKSYYVLNVIEQEKQEKKEKSQLKKVLTAFMRVRNQLGDFDPVEANENPDFDEIFDNLTDVYRQLCGVVGHKYEKTCCKEVCECGMVNYGIKREE